jgi:hypothetical protein
MTYFLVLLAVGARFVPHPWNLSPVYGALLLAGARLRTRDAFWYPLMLLLASDFLLTSVLYGLHFGWLEETVDLIAFAAVLLVGQALRNRVTAPRVVAAAVAGGTVFFLISNLGVWLCWKTFPLTREGLVACYLAALPYFRNTLVTSLLFSGVLFGADELYRRKFARPDFTGSVVRPG